MSIMPASEEAPSDHPSMGSSFEEVDRGSISNREFSPVGGEDNDKSVTAGEDVREPKASILIQPDLETGIEKLALESSSTSSGLSSDRPPPSLAEALRIDLLSYDNLSLRSTPGSLHKLPSLDGKSTMSGATFALDEKESLRPDDSASTRALEDDDTFSGVDSGVAASRVGSETGDRAFREQFYKIAARPDTSSPSHTSKDKLHRLSEQQYELAIDPSDFSRAQSKSRTETSGEDATSRFGFFEHGPDEKLLDAMHSPKDRLFLLRLEQDVINFINSSADPTIDLAPTNSYHRLLSHKLADYYCLTHVVDNLSTGIRLFRTPYCRVPPSLSTFPSGVTSPVSQTPPLNAMKIMSRAQLAKMQTQNSSQEGRRGIRAGGSSINDTDKTGSDSSRDSDGPTKPSDSASIAPKDRANMSREEREANYEAVRARIFKDFQENGASGPQTTPSQTSRTSSANGDKSQASMPRKQRTVQNDSFEARSQFTAYYPQQISQYSSVTQPSAFVGYPMQQPFGDIYNPIPEQVGSHGQPVAGVYLAPYIPRAGQYPSSDYSIPVQYQHMPINGTEQGYPGSAVHGHSPSNGDTPKMTPGVMYQPFAPYNGVSGNIMNHPTTQHNAGGWPGLGYAGQMPGQMQGSQGSAAWNRQNPEVMLHPGQMPYPYGPIPSQRPNADGPMHPMPGNYGRPSLNPQTQSFIPGGYNQGPPGGPQFHSAPNLMAPNLQGSNANRMNNGPMFPTQGFRTGGSFQPGSGRSSSASNIPTTSSIAKWGSPSHLPPKPPALPQASVYRYDIKAGLTAVSLQEPNEEPVDAGTVKRANNKRSKNKSPSGEQFNTS